MEEFPIVSPCVGVCALDAAGAYCVGCYRTRAEITDWPTASDNEKRTIIAALHARRRDARHADPLPRERRVTRRRAATSASENPEQQE